MEDEDVKKQIDSIVDRQAQIDTEVQMLTEAHKKAEERIGKLEGAIVTIVDLLGDIVKSQKEMVQIQKEMTQAQRSTDERVTELAEKVNDFITTFEVYISEKDESND